MRCAVLLFVPVLILMIGGCCSTSRVEVDGPALADVAWLAGSWFGVDEEGVATDEHWTPPRAESMLGVNRTVVDGRTVFFEFLRLEASPDGITYFAAPKGRHPATPFRLVSADGVRLVFENPDHDFPQRIIYERQGTRGLLMRIEGEQNGTAESSQWSLHRH